VIVRDNRLCFFTEKYCAYPRQQSQLIRPHDAGKATSLTEGKFLRPRGKVSKKEWGSNHGQKKKKRGGKMGRSTLSRKRHGNVKSTQGADFEQAQVNQRLYGERRGQGTEENRRSLEKAPSAIRAAPAKKGRWVESGGALESVGLRAREAPPTATQSH